MSEAKEINSPVFLPPDADAETLIRAAAENHKSWFLAQTVASGGEARETDGVPWLTTIEETILAFPRLSEENAGVLLDEITAECRARKTGRIACWALTPIVLHDLGAMLTARGFEWGWRPHWMVLDFRKIQADFPVPDGLRISQDDTGDWDVDDLPYYNKADTAKMQALLRAAPRQTWHFGAWLNGSLERHSVAHLTNGPLGVAGIYNVGVVPAARRQGIGRAITLAACQFAQSMGCHYALLNAATDIYAHIGFQSLGHGQTWWMQKAALEAHPPLPEQVAFVEAVGRGDIDALTAASEAARPANLDAPLLCGVSPMTLAVEAKQEAAVEWLAVQGATLDVLHAWDMGWKERAALLLAERPELADWQRGPRNLTPLHEAAFRNDLELARLILSAYPDLERCDSEYNGTPLNWAQQFDRADIIALIEAHERANPKA